MTEAKKGPGRPKGTKNGETSKPKKAAGTGRKYFIAPEDEYNNFVSGKDSYQNKEAALAAVDDAIENGAEGRFAIFEEAGFMGGEVIVKKVARKFESSRTIVRAPKGTETTEPAAAEEDHTAASTSETPQEAPAEPEAAPARRGRR